MEETRLAVLIDFENIAAGTEKEGLGKFDVDALMARIKDKGRILVARSYGDWGRFARFKQALLTANVTMMELTSHGMQDKNRADIAMVVDCLELAFTKDYIDTYVIVSGDSDFTPLVLKMRELNKKVIGIGTRGSTSRLLIQACDEFMFYDSVAARRQERRRRDRPSSTTSTTASPTSSNSPTADPFDALVEALEGLQREHPDPSHASIVKQAILRKHPDFSETEHGFSSFARFLEKAQEKGMVRVLRDRKSGGYRVDSVDSRQLDDEDGAQKADAATTSAYFDAYTPEAARELVTTLAAMGLHPLSAPARMTVLEGIVESVTERRKRRRRITVQFVMEDLQKRLRRTHPDMPPAALKGIFDALMKADLLMHRDGSPIRRPTAPFELQKTAEQLNKSLTELYLDLVGGKAPTADADTLAELFLGDKERRREIEELLAWLEARNSDEPSDGDSPAESRDTEDADADADADAPKSKRRRRRGKRDEADEPAAPEAKTELVDLDDLDMFLATDDEAEAEAEAEAEVIDPESAEALSEDPPTDEVIVVAEDGGEDSADSSDDDDLLLDDALLVEE
jgi:hypothetical protein